jgi:hypothetical protein
METMTGRRVAAETESGAERIARREAQRAASQEEARVVAKAGHRGHIPVEQQVEEAARLLVGTNVAQAIELIRAARPEQQDFLLLAEKAGANRKGVLGSFPAPRRAVQEQYDTPPPADTSGDPEQE